jgi:hypothetical protein
MGNPVSREPPKDPVIKYCIGCGKQIPVEMIFCGYCGMEQSPTPKPDPIDRKAATTLAGSKISTSLDWLPTVIAACIGVYLAARILACLVNGPFHGVSWWYYLVTMGALAAWRIAKENIKKKRKTTAEIDRTESWRKR